MTERGFEAGSNLDGTVGTEYKPVTKTESDRVEAEEYQGPKTTLEKIGESSKFKKAVVTVLLTGGIAMGSAAHKANAEGKPVSPSGTLSQSVLEGYTVKPETEDDPTPAVNPTPSSPESTPSQADAEYAATIAALESLGYSTEHYAERQKEINEYKKELRADGGQEINLQACAEACVIIDEAVEREKNQTESLNDNPEALFLNNYFNKEQVFEFCRTGEVPEGADFKVVYLKDKNGEKTNELGQFFVFNPNGPVFDISAIEETFDSLDEDFSRCLADNKVRVLLLTQLKRNGKDVTARTYYDGMIVFNFNSKKTNKFEDYLREGVGIEQYGSCALTLGMNVMESALIKGRMSTLCCEYLVGKKANKDISDMLRLYRSDSNKYFKMFEKYITSEEVDILVKNSKKLMVPFGAKSWAEIDAANSADVEAKSN